MPHIRFNWVDILFVTLLIRVGYVALKSGVLPEFFRFFGLLSAFIVSFNHYEALSYFLSARSEWAGSRPDIISFLFIFFSILFVFRVISIIAKIFFGGDNISRLNRISGFSVGIGRASLMIALVYVLLVNGPFAYLSRSAEDNSFSGRYISKIAPFVYDVCMKFYPGGGSDTHLVRLLKR